MPTSLRPDLRRRATPAPADAPALDPEAPVRRLRPGGRLRHPVGAPRLGRPALVRHPGRRGRHRSTAAGPVTVRANATSASPSATPSPSTRPGAVSTSSPTPPSTGSTPPGTGRPAGHLAASRYDSGDPPEARPDPAGSGTTPTIIQRGHRQFVAITDNADPRMHVARLPRRPRRPGRKPRVCRMPVFGKRRGGHRQLPDRLRPLDRRREQLRLHRAARDPAVAAPRSATPRPPQPGVTRVVVDYRRGGLPQGLDQPPRSGCPSSVSKASTATGLVYVYEHPAADEVRYASASEPVTGPQDPWYLTASTPAPAAGCGRSSPGSGSATTTTTPRSPSAPTARRTRCAGRPGRGPGHPVVSPPR